MRRDPGRLRFEIDARDGAARTGRLLTSHGVVATPAFIPLATTAAVRGLDTDEVRSAPSSAPSRRFRVIARGTSAGATWPRMELRIDGIPTVMVDSNSWKSFELDAAVTQGNDRLAVAFTNDSYGGPGQDRNLFVREVEL